MTEAFNKWWNEDLLTEDNPHVEGSAAYWAWEGWCAAVKVEREAMLDLALLHAAPWHFQEAIRNRGNT
jgi:hypothetical protein